MEERDKKTELLVGLFLFIGMILLGMLILQFSSVRELFKGTYSLTVALPDGTGIREGTPVMLGGSKIGKASAKPRLNEKFTGVIIPMVVYQAVKIPADAKFSIGTSGLLGDAFIEIKPSGKDTTKFVEPNTLVQGAPSTGLKNMQEAAEEIAKKVEVAIEELRNTLKKINEGVLSDDGVRDLKESFKHLNNVVTRLDEKTLNDETSADLKSAIAGLKNAAKTIEDGARKLDPAFTKIDDVATRAGTVLDKAGKVMDSADSAMKSLDKNAGIAGNAVRDLTKGDGLLPALLKDSQLRTEFQRLITNLRVHGILHYSDSAGKGENAKADDAPRTARPLTGSKR